jgi:hypothetical protein
MTTATTSTGADDVAQGSALGADGTSAGAEPDLLLEHLIDLLYDGEQTDQACPLCRELERRAGRNLARRAHR